MKPALSLSNEEAKRISLDALGFIENRPATVDDVFERLNLLQIDSVNVFERAHYLPLFSRIGNYQKSDLEEKTGGFAPKLIEYWAHEASIIRTNDLPLFHWRMKDKRYNSWDEKMGRFIAQELRSRGPLTTSDFEHPSHERKGAWWGWSDVKRTLEHMFYCGELVSGGRSGFKRIYALPEQVLPSNLMENPPSKEDAQKTLVLRAAKALGVASHRDLADYFRIPATQVTALLEELVEAEDLIRVNVDDWLVGAYALPSISPKTQGHLGTTVLSPFDPVCWNRNRTSRLFGFDYKIEIYVPEPKRVFGYYSLPLIHNGNLIARLDLKSNRQAGVLEVRSTWAENDFAKKFPSNAVAKHLISAMNWQGLDSLQISDRGNRGLELAAHFT